MFERSIAITDPKPAATRMFAMAALALGLLVQPAAAVRAQPVCMPHDELTKQLYAKFAEAPAANAIANNGALVELFATRDRSSWTLAMTRPGGMSCVLVAGEEWNRFPEFWRDQMVEVPDREATP
ncbi:MAG: hypothetical protein IID48_19265 [Proteobacteria bacterium]|nr:hypothetical protein [Pseudomonadota bacterium]